jgi:hypothetical protein
MRRSLKMKKSILILVTLALVAGLLVGCAKKTALGPSILTVSGSIGTKNSGETYLFDEATFGKYSVEQDYVDPWVGEGTEAQKYKGVLLSKLIEVIKPASGATVLSLVAVDGKALDVPIADAQKWDIMLVHWNAGTVLDEKSGGPVKLAFPDAARQTYPDDEWMWWLKEIKVK